jgi:hypothetical protein
MEFVCFAVSLLSLPCITHSCSDAERIDGTAHGGLDGRHLCQLRSITLRLYQDGGFIRPSFWTSTTEVDRQTDRQTHWTVVLKCD